MGCLTSWMYAGMFLLFVFAWPLFLAEAVPAPYLIILLLVNGLIAVNVWYQCSSREFPYFAGLNAISASLMSGGANITLLALGFTSCLFVFHLLFSTWSSPWASECPVTLASLCFTVRETIRL